jgi:hypothetical protein
LEHTCTIQCRVLPNNCSWLVLMIELKNSNHLRVAVVDVGIDLDLFAKMALCQAYHSIPAGSPNMG